MRHCKTSDVERQITELATKIDNLRDNQNRLGRVINSEIRDP